MYENIFQLVNQFVTVREAAQMYEIKVSQRFNCLLLHFDTLVVKWYPILQNKLTWKYKKIYAKAENTGIFLTFIRMFKKA